VKRVGPKQTVLATAEIVKYITSQYAEILEQGFIGDDNKSTKSNRVFSPPTSALNKSSLHYWDKICDKVSSDTVKFVKSYSKNSEKEKAKLWILLEFSQKNLHEATKQIYEKEEIRTMWDEESIFRKYYNDLYSALDKLKNANYIIDSDVLRAFYEAYPKNKPKGEIEDNSKGYGNNNNNTANNNTSAVDTDTIRNNLARFNKTIDPKYRPATATYQFNEDSNNSNNKPMTESTNNGQSSNNGNGFKKYNNGNGLAASAYNHSNSNNNTTATTSGYSTANNSNNYALAKSNSNNMSTSEFKPETKYDNNSNKFAEIPMTQSTNLNATKKTETTTNNNNDLSKSTKVVTNDDSKPRQKGSIVEKIDRKKQLELLRGAANKQATPNGNYDNYTTSEEKKETRAVNKPPPVEVEPVGKHHHHNNNNNGWKDDYNNQNHNNNYSDDYDEDYDWRNKPGKPADNNAKGGYIENKSHSNDSSNDVTPTVLGSSYNDTPGNGEEKKMKNSEILYEEQFKALEYFEYAPRPEKEIKLEEQDYKCRQCRELLNKWVLLVKPSFGYCHYTGYWYCGNCISKEKKLIPWYVLEKWDFKAYPVCKQAQEELDKLYTKYILKIELTMDIVKKNKVLYDCLVMKRQLHLIFDMICQTSFIFDFLQSDGNLLLKINLFSLRNLYDIYNGSMYKHMEIWYTNLSRHIMQACPTCTAKGKICTICKDDKNKLFPFDIKNTSFCPTCKKFYHARCLQVRKCINCYHNQ
jgi:hypothetical protein